MNKKADTKPSKHLIRRGSIYYFRLVVPKPLRKSVGQSEFQKSLETDDYETALRLVAREREKALAIIREARDKDESGSKSRFFSTKMKSDDGEGTVQPPKALTVTSEKHALKLARQWFLELEKDGANWWRRKRQSLCQEDREDLLADLWLDEGDITGEAGGRIPDRYEDGSHEIERFLESRNLLLDKKSEGFPILASFLLDARLEFVRRQRDRIEGKEARAYSLAFKDLTENSPDLPIGEEMAVGDLVTKFVEEIAKSGKAPKSVSSYKGTGRLLIETFGESRSIGSLEREDVELFADYLEKMPPHRKKRYPGMSIPEAIAEALQRGDNSRLQPNTLQGRYFDAFAIFGYAVAIKAISSNPFDDHLLKDRFTVGEDEDEGDPFTPPELQAIFHAPLYTGCIDDRRGYGKPGPNVIRRGRFWVPLLALFHGMRENEICQLHTADVGDWEGGLYLEIRSGDDRRLKNRSSKRTIPVHPEVFKFGFREYVAMRRRATDSPRLFPDLTMASTGSYSDNFSKWFANFLLKVFGRKIEATFHSFRHTFTSACRAVDISPQRIDSLCGWAGGGRQQRKYGVAAPVSVLAEDLNRVSFNGLDLSHLYLPQVQEIAITARERVRVTKRSVSP